MSMHTSRTSKTKETPSRTSTRRYRRRRRRSARISTSAGSVPMRAAASANPDEERLRAPRAHVVAVPLLAENGAQGAGDSTVPITWTQTADDAIEQTVGSMTSNID